MASPPLPGGIGWWCVDRPAGAISACAREEATCRADLADAAPGARCVPQSSATVLTLSRASFLRYAAFPSTTACEAARSVFARYAALGVSVSACIDVGAVAAPPPGTRTAERMARPPSSPGWLSVAEVGATMAPVAAQVARCPDGADGVIAADVAVAPDGTVQAVATRALDPLVAPAPTLAACIEATIAAATFPTSQKGARFSYPFRFAAR